MICILSVTAVKAIQTCTENKLVNGITQAMGVFTVMCSVLKDIYVMEKSNLQACL